MNLTQWSPELHCESVVLKRLHSADAQGIFALRRSPDNFKYVPMKAYANLERAQKFVKAVMRELEHKEICYWGIFIDKESELIGTACLWNFSDDGKIGEIGYELLPAYQGQGLMRQAVAAVIEYGFEGLKLDAIHAITHCEHEKSIALLMHFGFNLEGVASEIDPELEEAPEMRLYTLKKPCMNENGGSND